MNWKNPYPSTAQEFSDLRGVIEAFVLPGLVPEKPFISRSSKVIALGSCFAEHIYNALVRAKISTAHLSLSETLNTPPFTLITMHYLAGRKEYASLVGHMSTSLINEDGLRDARSILDDTNLFILTLGVATQPFHDDGKPSFRLTARTLFATTWRMLSVDEIVNYVRSTIRIIRELRPEVTVVLTLSPIPLNNAMTGLAPIVEDCISKSRLRVAIDELMAEGQKGVFYWPTFEVVRWVGSHIGPFLGDQGQDHRHVAPMLIDLVTALFIDRFFEPPISV